jgi:hypothetical protein
LKKAFPPKPEKPASGGNPRKGARLKRFWIVFIVFRLSDILLKAPDIPKSSNAAFSGEFPIPRRLWNQ